MDSELTQIEERIQKMKAYEDPLLKAFDEEQKTQPSPNKGSDDESSEEGSSSDESSSEEELSDIVFPKTDATSLLQFIMRDLNNLADKEDK